MTQSTVSVLDAAALSSSIPKTDRINPKSGRRHDPSSFYSRAWHVSATHVQPHAGSMSRFVAPAVRDPAFFRFPFNESTPAYTVC